MHLMNNSKKNSWRNKPMQTNESKDMEWVSVSELAELLNVSKQTIYNKVKAHLYEIKNFKRGKMVGILIKKPKNLAE